MLFAATPGQLFNEKFTPKKVFFITGPSFCRIIDPLLEPHFQKICGNNVASRLLLS